MESEYAAMCVFSRIHAAAMTTSPSQWDATTKEIQKCRNAVRQVLEETLQRQCHGPPMTLTEVFGEPLEDMEEERRLMDTL